MISIPFLTSFLAFAFVLGVLVMVHEFGHFWVAKKSGVRVLKFSIGMGPRLAGFRRGETEYLLSWIPFGGYVKMAGEDPEEGGTGAPDEFSSKRPGVRAAIIFAGPFMNYLLGIAVYTGIFAVRGIETIDTRQVGEVEVGSAAERNGFQVGDEIVAIGATTIEDWDDLGTALEKTKPGPLDVRVLREESEVAIGVEIPREGAAAAFDGISPFISTEIGDVQKNGPAWNAGLRTGDKVLSIGGTPVTQWTELARRVHESPGVPLEISWERGGAIHTATVTPEEGEVPKSNTEVEKAGLIRIGQKWDRESVGLWKALVLGFDQTWWMTREVVRGIASLPGAIYEFITGHHRALDMLGGPLRIGQIAGESARWGLVTLFRLMAFLSVNLAVLNLLPIPILDGGHLLFLAVEKVMGRALTLRQRIVLQQIGLAVIILLMVTVTAVDFRRLFR